jgi:hypothetical protein
MNKYPIRRDVPGIPGYSPLMLALDLLAAVFLGCLFALLVFSFI